MAVNGASHNAAGIPTGPATGQPPPLSDESTEAILKAAKEDSIGVHQGGEDVPPPIETDGGKRKVGESGEGDGGDGGGGR